jgi:hypothetical protein
MLQDTYGLNPRLLPKSLHDSHGTPKPKLARIAHQEHEMNWVEAIKGKAEISSPFSFAARLVEVMLLGVVALRAGGKIYYDADKARVTNMVKVGSKTIDPNEFLTRNYREGFKLT